MQKNYYFITVQVTKEKRKKKPHYFSQNLNLKLFYDVLHLYKLMYFSNSVSVYYFLNFFFFF